MPNLTFRFPKLSDLNLLLNHINTASSEHTFIRMQGHQVTEQEEKQYLESTIKDIENKRAVMLMAFDGENLVGTADVRTGFGAEAHVGKFGIIVAKKYRGMGIGTQLMRKTLRKAKEHIAGLEIIKLGVFSDNERGIHLYKDKFGFKEFGRLPNGVIRNKQHYDGIEMYLDDFSNL